ncbi:VWA domain-containing protein [Streptomyces sp. AC536]|uniref:vWA domain-containing protein n=1 Tax=Streptomyces buecherae TaxID=2763006 RepID=UPI00164DC21B|nr:VWA domain-containing protein [Streptomyces buecherae]MBC3985784.1 VWA domain-containing protein [Streptomyces buecherae]QNJ41098.1 VWA domain-containing protein [Streptomyces buecherae]
MGIRDLLRKVFGRSRTATDESEAPRASAEPASEPSAPPATDPATPSSSTSSTEPEPEHAAASASGPTVIRVAPREPLPDDESAREPDLDPTPASAESATESPAKPAAESTVEPPTDDATATPAAEAEAGAATETKREPEAIAATPASKPEAETEPEAVTPEPEAEADAPDSEAVAAADEPDPEPVRDAEPEATAGADPEPEPKPGLEPKSKPAADLDPVPETRPDAAPEPLAVAEAGPEPVAVAETGPELAADAEPVAEPDAEPTSEPAAAAAPAPEADAQAEPETENEPEPVAESEPVAAASADADAGTNPGAALSLAKVEEAAPGLVSLYKAASAVVEKHGLGGQRAAVYLVLDRSGSMRRYYKDGTVQHLAEQALGLSAHFDDDGVVPVVFFSTDVDGTAELELANYSGRIEELHGSLGHMGRTNYHWAINAVVEHYEKSGSTDPAFVIFQTDGAPTSKPAAERALCEAARLPIFWQFVGFGDPQARGFDFLRKLDDLAVPERRPVDNAGFFHAGLEPRDLSDAELYGQLMVEFPEWLIEAREAGVLR